MEKQMQVMELKSIFLIITYTKEQKQIKTMRKQ